MVEPGSPKPALARGLVAGEHDQPFGSAFLGAAEGFVVRGPKALMELGGDAEEAHPAPCADQIRFHDRHRAGGRHRAPLR